MSKAEKIVKHLESTGTLMEKEYSHEELLNEYKSFERLLLKQVFRDEYSDSLRTYDLVSHFKSMASKYSLTNNQTYCATIDALEQLTSKTASFVNGARGEMYAQHALNRLAVDNELLTNIELNYGGEQVEIDDIVITSSGVFVVEVKYNKANMVVEASGALRAKYGRSASDYNVGEHMQSKLHVLWKTIEPQAADWITRDMLHGVLLNANNKTFIEDRFGRVPIKTCGNVNYFIEDTTERKRITAEQVEIVKEAIESARVTTTYAPEIDFDALRRSFAETIILFESASKNAEIVEEYLYEEKASKERAGQEFCLPRWARNALGALGVVAVSGAAAYGVSRIPQVRNLINA